MFVTAFVAATVFPAQSETVLVGLIVSDSYSAPALVAVAPVGNTLAVRW